MQQQFDVEVEWRGFQLHPEVPPGGVDVADYFGASRAERFHQRLVKLAGEFGVEIGRPTRVPWTLKPLAVTEYARDHGKLEPFRDAVMEAHWFGAEDIESDDVLGRIASEVGLDVDEAVSSGADEAYLSRLRAARQEAFDRMVTAIPTFLFGSYPVVGCQAYETLELVAKKVGVPERS